MSYLIIAVAIIIAGWLIANSINPPTQESIQAKNDEKTRSNARKELNKLIYELSLKHFSDTKIADDPTAYQLLKLEFHNYPNRAPEDLLYSSATIRSQRRSASYFMTNTALLKRLKELFATNYDDAKIASEFCRLEGQQYNIEPHDRLYDVYNGEDITHIKVDPHLIAAIKRLT